jgi:hypothetical protein
MTINEVAGLFGYSKERVERLLTEGLALPKSASIVQLSHIATNGVVDISEDQFNDFVGQFEKEEPGRWPPAAVRRELLVEARHRCGICRDAAPLQSHHMLDWAKVQHHDARHMLAVCGTCHTRCTNGEIDYKAQVAYKAALKGMGGMTAPAPDGRVLTSVPELMPEAQAMLVDACAAEGGEKGKIVWTLVGDGWVIRCGTTVKHILHQDRQAQARWEAALEQLADRRLVDITARRTGLGGNLLGWYTVRYAGYSAAEELLRRRAAPKAGSVNLSGDISAGSGKEGPGGHVIAKGGTGRHGASGGDMNAGPGNYKAGDGGKAPGGDIIFKGGDAE